MSPPPLTDDTTDNNDSNKSSQESGTATAVTTMESTTTESSQGNPTTLVLPNRSLLDNDEGADEDDKEDPKDDPSSDVTDDNNKEDLPVEKDQTEQQVSFPGGFNFVPDNSPLLETFVQQASRVHSLVVSAWQAPPQCIKRAREAAAEDEPEEPLPQRRRLSVTDTLTEKIAKEKAEQVVALQHKLQGVETELSTLRSTNESLRQEVSVTQARYERTAEALRLSQRNAAQARADADAAENTSNNLAQTLQSLQAIVRETQDATRHLQASHDEIEQKSTAVQADLWQKEVHVACVEKDYNALTEKCHTMERAQMSWKQEKAQLEESVEEKERKIGAYERQWQERRTMDAARSARVQQMEQDLLKAREQLVEASAAEATAAETQSQLRSDLRTLQQKNEELHQRLTQMQEKSRQVQERHDEALQQAEKEGNQWHIQLETSQDNYERLRMEKLGLEKQISHLKAQLADKVTGETNQASHSVSPETGKTDGLPSASVTPAANRDKENTGNTIRFASSTPPGGCVICGKESYGLMKRCPCGKCGLRAHFSCCQRIGKPVGISVAHPGTPYPRASFVLCTAAGSPSSPTE